MDIDHHGIEDDLKALERRLAAWRPSPGALDRDRMLYDSGLAAANEGRIRAWRMATAALLLLSTAMGGLLVQQRTSLDRERALLARERSERRSTELAFVARNAPSEPSPTPSATKLEPLSPSSYFALSARGVRDGSSTDLEIEPGPHRPPTEPAETLPQPDPLGPRDVQRVLDL